MDPCDVWEPWPVDVAVVGPESVACDPPADMREGFRLVGFTVRAGNG